MEKVRVLMAVAPRLWCEALGYLLDHQEGVDVIGRVRSLEEALVRTRTRPADVVVANLDSAPGVPEIIADLLAENPDMVVIGIDPDRQCARTYRNRIEVRTIADFSATDLVRTVLWQSPTGRRGGDD